MRVHLEEVVYDKRAKDGTWCCLPYPPNHDDGCPNFPKCINERPDFLSLPPRNWFAIVEEFDLKAHADERRRIAKEQGKTISRWQARNRHFWQKKVVAKLKKKAEAFCAPLMGDILLDIPEACGVNLFATMAKHGVFLKADPDLVRKIMLVGKVHSSFQTTSEKEKTL